MSYSLKDLFSCVLNVLKIKTFAHYIKNSMFFLSTPFRDAGQILFGDSQQCRVKCSMYISVFSSYVKIK